MTGNAFFRFIAKRLASRDDSAPTGGSGPCPLCPDKGDQGHVIRRGAGGQAFPDAFGAGAGIALAQQRGERRFVQNAGQPVGTQQEAIAGTKGEAHFIYPGGGCPDGLSDDVSPHHAVGLRDGEFPLVDLFLTQRMIACALVQNVVAQQIATAVARPEAGGLFSVREQGDDGAGRRAGPQGMRSEQGIGLLQTGAGIADMAVQRGGFGDGGKLSNES